MPAGAFTAPSAGWENVPCTCMAHYLARVIPSRRPCAAGVRAGRKVMVRRADRAERGADVHGRVDIAEHALCARIAIDGAVRLGQAHDDAPGVGSVLSAARRALRTV